MNSFHVHLGVYDILKGERQCKKKSKGERKGRKKREGGKEGERGGERD